MNLRTALVGLMLALLVGLLVSNFVLKSTKLPELLHEVAVEPPQTLGALKLIDHNKQTVDLESFKNKWTFIFIGFTHCAHICVPTLSQLALLKKAMLKQAVISKDRSFVFISVDPKRDTPEHLAKYMLNFDPDFMGMSGEETAVLTLEKRLNAFHRVRQDKRRPQSYDFDHSGEIFLIDPQARLTAKFHPPLQSDKVIQQFKLLVSSFNKVTPES